jgi:hypothetical protein
MYNVKTVRRQLATPFVFTRQSTGVLQAGERRHYPDCLNEISLRVFHNIGKAIPVHTMRAYDEEEV